MGSASLHVKDGEITTAKLADLAVTNAKVAAAAAIALTKLASTPALLAHGTYAGNSTANRAVAHGLGILPQIIFIIGQSGASSGIFSMSGYYGNIYQGTAFKTVTVSDTTNFYVGNAADYDASANGAATWTYYWVAMS